MSKEQYYNGIKKFFYRKFDELEVVESDDGNDIYLHYKNEKYAKVRISKISGYVYYYHSFSDKICKIISLEYTDFKILLKRWVEETFQMTVTETWIAECKVEEIVEDTYQIKIK